MWPLISLSRAEGINDITSSDNENRNMIYYNRVSGLKCRVSGLKCIVFSLLVHPESTFGWASGIAKLTVIAFMLDVFGFNVLKDI